MSDDAFGRHACPYCLCLQEMEKDPGEEHQTKCVFCGGVFLTRRATERTLQRRNVGPPVRQGGEW